MAAAAAAAAVLNAGSDRRNYPGQAVHHKARRVVLSTEAQHKNYQRRAVHSHTRTHCCMLEQKGIVVVAVATQAPVAVGECRTIFG